MIGIPNGALLENGFDRPRTRPRNGRRTGLTLPGAAATLGGEPASLLVQRVRASGGSDGLVLVVAVINDPRTGRSFESRIPCLAAPVAVPTRMVAVRATAAHRRQQRRVTMRATQCEQKAECSSGTQRNDAPTAPLTGNHQSSHQTNASPSEQPRMRSHVRCLLIPTAQTKAGRKLSKPRTTETGAVEPTTRANARQTRDGSYSQWEPAFSECGEFFYVRGAGTERNRSISLS